MAIVTPSRPQPETARASDVPEMLFPEARRRRRRRWIVGITIVLLSASGVSLGVAVSGSGSGGGSGHASSPVPPDRAPTTTSAAPVSGVELAGGRWSRMAAPHPGAENLWSLAAWTGKYVIAWGSSSPCCGAVPTESAADSSEHGAAFDPASGAWRSLPAAPVSFTVESTVWTGRQVLAWGSTSRGPGQSRNVMLAFDPATWRWERPATPEIAARSRAQVVWTGSTMIVFGGEGASGGLLLDGASYDPGTNRWSPLPAVPRFPVGAGSQEEPISVTVAWATNSLYVWVAHQVSRVCGAGCGDISGTVQALRWNPGTHRWLRTPTPPKDVSVYDATAVSMGNSIALLDGSSCLPSMSCPAALSGTPALLNVQTDKWSSIAANAVLGSAVSFAWTPSG